jgi:8-oxo-dGTP pyrophosphatase MutT (NUDIX family)
MPPSDYVARLRQRIGHDLLVLPSVTGVVRDKEDRILLVKHSDTRSWVAPGGSIDPDESPADAVVREVHEETGILVEPERVLGVYGGPDFQVHYDNGDRTSYVMTVFECRYRAGQLQPDGVETLECGYFSRDELQLLNVSAWVRIVLRNAFSNQESSFFEKTSWRPKQ